MSLHSLQPLRFVAGLQAHWYDMALGLHKTRLQKATQARIISAIELGLEPRFGDAGLALLPDIQPSTDLPRLAAIYATMRPAQSPDDIRRVYQPWQPPEAPPDNAAGETMTMVDLRDRRDRTRWLWAGLGGYAAVCGLAYRFQRRLIYFPRRRLIATPANLGLTYEDVWLTTPDGERLHGWYVPVEAARRQGTLLFLHGNGGNLSSQMDAVQMFARLGYSSLYIDYRGYGNSTGRPFETGLYRDAATAWRYLVETHNIAPESLVLVGRSLGGGVASWLALRHPPRVLILQTTFTALIDVAAMRYPWLPVRWMMQHHYPTIQRLPLIQVPVLVAHSPDDQVIPFIHGLRLFAAANEPRMFLELRGGHSTGFRQSEAVLYAGMQKFLQEHAR